jgi:hypothetical protein
VETEVAAEMSETTAAPPAVSRFEYNLLRLARFAFGKLPPESAQALVDGKLPAPPCLTRTTINLLKDTLAKGTVLHLVRAGGWRDERFLKNQQPVNGRAWERVPLGDRKLSFGPASVSFLIWLTAERPTDAKDGWDAPTALTAGDELFLALALDALRPMESVSAALATRPAFRKNPWCWLLSAALFGDATPPDFAPLFAPPRVAMLECLQPDLARRWVRSERSKGQISDWRAMRRQGQAEFAALSGFLAAADAAGRRDLARFVLHAAATIFAPAQQPLSFWTGGLHGSGPPRLADRLETQRAALALPRQLDTLQSWDRAARGVGYWDDGYAAAQVWKADWEAARGADAAAKAHRLLEQLDPLRAT